MPDILQPDPSLSPKERDLWIRAQKKIKFSLNPPLKTVETKDGGTGVFGDLRRVEQTTPVKAPVAQ